MGSVMGNAYVGVDDGGVLGYSLQVFPIFI